MKSTKKIVYASMLAALVCVATMIIKIPSPFKGYINLGDCIVLLCGWLLSPVYGFLSAGIGSALADIFSGYVIYALPTFIIKGVMAVTSYYVFKGLKNRLSHSLSRLISGFSAELIMVIGYFVFEGVLYGFIPSSANILANLFQGIVGLILGIILIRIFEKSNISF